MKFPLGAMTVGDILDRGLKMLVGRFPTFFAINLLFLSPCPPSRCSPRRGRSRTCRGSSPCSSFSGSC